MSRYRLLVADKRLGEAGTIVVLTDEEAAWYRRDRGCELFELIAEGARVLDAPPRDRMVRKARKRG